MKRLIDIGKNLKQILNDSNVELVNKGLNSADSLYSVATELSKIEIDKLPQVLSKEIIEVREEDFGEGKIKDYAFYDCKNLMNITIPNSITTIGGHAFYNCESLTEVTIPDGVTTIGAEAFYSCSSLTEVIIPDSVTTIGRVAFMNTPYYNNQLNWENNTLYIDNHLIKYNGTANNIIIKDNIITLADEAFSENAYLKTINLPSNLRNIGKNAFYNCTSLKSITIPDSVETIGVSAFEECRTVTNINIPNNITKIENRAFYKVGSHSGRDIPIIIHNNIISIGDEAFCEASLGELIIKNGIEYIGKSAFYKAGINSSMVHIPESVKFIGAQAFTNNSYVQSYYFYSKIPPVLEQYCFNGANIYVPTDSVDVYKSATNWSAYSGRIYGHDKIYEEE